MGLVMCTKKSDYASRVIIKSTSGNVNVIVILCLKDDNVNSHILRYRMAVYLHIYESFCVE